MIGGAALVFEGWLRRDPARTAAHLARVPRWVVRRIARAKLARTLRHVWDRSSAQRERWQAAGIRRGDLGRAEAFARLPFTTADDISARGAELLCAPEGELIHVLATSGTKGRRKSIYLTAGDLDVQARAIGSNYRMLPGASRGMAIFDVGNSGWSAGPMARRGFEAAGFFALLKGPSSGPESQLDLLRDHAIDTLIATPTCVHRLTRGATRDLRALGVRYILLSGQPWTEALRAEIESAWGARVIDVYASTEFACGIASECVEQKGLHLNEADLWPEVIDPATGRVLADGEEGELVLTTLGRRGMPLVRYRTGDFARLLGEDERCACGSPLRRMSRVRGRVDDMLIIGSGNNVYPDEFDRALFALPGLIDYQIVLDKADGWRDVLRVTAEAAPGAGVTPEAVERALLTVEDVAHSRDTEHTLEIAPPQVVAPGLLSRGRPKTNRIVDRRSQPA